MRRFGIMEMQIDRLIPSGVRPEDALELVLHFDRAKLVRDIAQDGFKLIELGGDLGLFFPTAYEADNIERLANLKQDLGLAYTLHLPLWSVEPSTPLTPVRSGSVEAIIHTIHAASPLEPEVFVLHATGALAAEFYRMELPLIARQMSLKQFQAGAINSIETILEKTGIPSRKLAVETVEFPLELTLEIADLLDLSICLDTGHVLAGFSGEIAFQDALNACSPRMAEVHLHDSPDYMKTKTIGYGKDHQPLGTGDLDINLLLGYLAKQGFDGPIIFELTIEQARTSLAYLERIGVQL